MNVTDAMVARAKESLKHTFYLFVVLLVLCNATYWFGKVYRLNKPAPTCKVCHCGQSSCHRECGEEAVFQTRCEGLCKRK